MKYLSVEQKVKLRLYLILLKVVVALCTALVVRQNALGFAQRVLARLSEQPFLPAAALTD
jgi:hypothetical protein